MFKPDTDAARMDLMRAGFVLHRGVPHHGGGWLSALAAKRELRIAGVELRVLEG